MKKLSLLFCFLLFASICYCQSETVDSLVQKGIDYCDNGQYKEALEVYNEALKLDPAYTMINYEIAYTYIYMKEYENAIKYCDIVLKESNDNKAKIQTLVLKGSALDYLGKTDESIELMEGALKDLGPDHLLYYNLGIDYYRLEKTKKAEDAFVNAIKIKNSHPSSHWLLGNLMESVGRKSKSLLCLYYFLMNEPDTERSKKAYKMLTKMLSGEKAKVDNETKKSNVTIKINPEENEFASIDLLLSLMQISKIDDKNKDKAKEELFVNNTKTFFDFLKNDKNKSTSTFWREFYVPFFVDLNNANLTDVFCHYIGATSSEYSAKWLKNNTDKVDKFVKWLKERK